MKTLKLSKYEVDISEDKIKWGEREIIKFTFIDPLSGAVTAETMLNAKIKRFGFSIKEIREGDKKINFSKEWVMNLSSEDGNILADEFNLIDEKKNTTLTVEK